MLQNEVSLRPLEAEDVDRVLQWRNQDHVRRFMFHPDIISHEQHIAWLANTLKRDDADYQIVLFDGQPAGLADAVNIDADSASCEWGFYLGEKDLPKGSGTLLALHMLDHIFDNHPVNTIRAEVFAFNNASNKLHEKVGFTPDPDNDSSRMHEGEEKAVLAWRLERTDWHQARTQLLQSLQA